MRPDKRLLLQLCIGVWVCISNGAIFIFGIFSPQLRSAPFNFSQSEVNVIATVGAVSSYMTLPVGVLYDRGGPRVVILVGALVSLIGWLGVAYLFWCVDVDESQRDLSSMRLSDQNSTVVLNLPKWLDTISSFYLVAIFYGLSQLSSPFFEQGAVLTNLLALSSHKGDVVLIQKTFMGLGSSIISQVYTAYYLVVAANSGTNAEGGDAGISSSINSTVVDDDYVNERHRMGGFCLFIAVFSAFSGLVGAMFNRVPASARPLSEDEGTVHEEGSSDRFVASRVSRFLKRVFSTPSCPVVRGINGGCQKKRIDDADKRQHDYDHADNGHSDSGTIWSQKDETNKEDEYAATILYGPFFFTARWLAILIIFMVSTITFVNNFWPIDGEESEDGAGREKRERLLLFQKVSVGIVLTVCALGFFLCTWLFSPKHSYEEAIALGTASSNATDCVVRLPSTTREAAEEEKETAASRCRAMVDSKVALDQNDDGAHAAVGGGAGVGTDGSVRDRGIHQTRRSSKSNNTDARREGEETSPTSSPRRSRQIDEERVKLSDLKINTANRQASDVVALFSHQQRERKEQIPIVSLRQNTLTLWKNVTSDSQHLFLLFAIRSVIIMGVTTTVSSNSSQLYFSLAGKDEYTDTSNAAIVSVFGVANALGRVAAGMLDRYMAKRKRAQQYRHQSLFDGHSVAVHHLGQGATNGEESENASGLMDVSGDRDGQKTEKSAIVRKVLGDARDLSPSSGSDYGGCKPNPRHHQQPMGDVVFDDGNRQNPSTRRQRGIAPSYSRLQTESIAMDCFPWYFRLFKIGQFEKATNGAQNANGRHCCRPLSVALVSFLTGCRPGESFHQIASSSSPANLETAVGVPASSGFGWNVLHLSLIPHVALLLAFPLFFLVPGPWLIIPFALVGFATGSLWGGLILAVSHLYSEACIGGHYGALGVGGMLTPIVFNIVLFGFPYDAVLERRHLSTSQWCEGLECVVVPLASCTAVNFVGTVICIVLCRWASRRESM